MAAPTVPPLALEWAARLSALEHVEAVALGGSTSTGAADATSDLDLEVYASPLPPLDARRALILPVAARAEVGNDFFGPGDEWIGLDGRGLDVAYFDPAWMEDQVDRALVRHEAAVGWSTCFWHTVRECRILFDRSGRLGRLQERARAPYPEALRRAVVAKNRPVLRTKIASFAEQIELAQRRDDPVSVQHRVAALLASAFDVLFAVNRVPNPGEKRLLQHAARLCPLRPPRWDEQVRAVLDATGDDLLPRVHDLLDGLDDLLRAEGLLP